MLVYELWMIGKKMRFGLFNNCNIFTCIICLYIHNIYLHAKSPQIKLNSFVLRHLNVQSFYEPKHYSYNNESHIIDLYFNDKLLSADYVLKIEFHTTIDNDEEGLLKTFYINKERKRM